MLTNDLLTIIYKSKLDSFPRRTGKRITLIEELLCASMQVL